MKLVKPQHFLPVHGEYSFLTAHAQLAQDIGIKNTSVIRNGQMLGVQHRRNANVVSTTGASVKGMQLLGEVKLRMLYNDGNKVRYTSKIACLCQACSEEGRGVGVCQALHGMLYVDGKKGGMY